MLFHNKRSCSHGHPKMLLLSEVQRRRNADIHKIYVLEGVRGAETKGKLCKNTVFFLGNSMTIKFGKIRGFDWGSGGWGTEGKLRKNTVFLGEFHDNRI